VSVILRNTFDDALRAACADVGVVYKDVPADGRFHRADVEGDRRGHDDASIKVFADGEGGFVHNWKTDEETFFFVNDDLGEMTETDRRNREQRRADRIRQADQDKVRLHADAQWKAAMLWNAATPATADHPYLNRKQISPVTTLREIDATAAAKILGYTPKSSDGPLSGRFLVVPIKVGDKISTAEFIDEAGNKAAIYGGLKKAGYWSAQRLPDGNGKGFTVLIGEGVATVLSATEATGHAAIAALSCGNLNAVAHVIRERYPAATLIILADIGNGQTHAVEAARSINGLLAIPDFGDNRPAGMTDFNDLSVHSGAHAVKSAIAKASWPQSEAPVLIRLSDVQPEKIRWAWEGRIALGKLCLVIGDPGTGKSTATLDVGSRITRGMAWPDGGLAPLGNVILLSAEDGVADTIRPRVDLHGGNPNSFYILQAIKQNDSERAFNLVSDIDALENAITTIGNVRLVVIDPLSAYLGDKNSYKDSEIRSVLAPLIAMAERYGVAIIGIMHMGKSEERKALYRALGSIAFVAAARTVFAVGKDKDDSECQIFVGVKNNLAQMPKALAYRIVDGVLRWEDRPIEGVDADSILSGSAPEELGARRDAVEFLKETLAAGERLATETIKAAREIGISERTLNRAKAELGVKSRPKGKPGEPGPWFWRLPDAPPKTATPPPKVAKSENLATFEQVKDATPVTSISSPKIATSPDMAAFGGNLREDDREKFEL